MVDPVLGVGGLCGGDPRAGQVRQIGQLWLGQRDAAHGGEELGQDRIEQRAVRRRGERDAGARDAVGRETLVEREHVGGMTRHDAFVERVDCRERNGGWQDLAHLRLG